LSLKFEGFNWSVHSLNSTNNAARMSAHLTLPLGPQQEPFTINVGLPEESTFEDKQAVYELAAGAKFAIDVGSFTGSSAHAILSNESVERLICIDTFSGTRGIDVKTGKVRGNTANTPGWLAFYGLNHRLAEFNGRFSIWVGTSNGLADILQDGIADFIFIDAAHTYSWVEADISLWLPKLKPDGILAGHDFDKGIKDMSKKELRKLKDWEVWHGTHPGVVLAVREAFEHYELTEHENSSVWWAKPEWYKGK
jgi:predicted O-methyltransferase YrrM